MGKRLKQIKRADLGENAKKVVDSLIDTGKRPRRDEREEEQMRCKVEIFEGLTKIKALVDSFIVNTNYIEDTITDIVLKYGSNVQFRITNLYDEKVVVNRFVYTDGYDKEREDRICYNRSLDLIKKILKMKEEGICLDSICSKFCAIAARTYITEVYNKTEEEGKQRLRDIYNNQSLGTENGLILSEDLNTKKDNIDISNLEGETNDE